MGQQSEEEGAQHTSLGGPCVQCDGAGCITADPYCLRSPSQEVQRVCRESRFRTPTFRVMELEVNWPIFTT